MTAQSEGDISEDVEVREERALLRDDPHPPSLRRNPRGGACHDGVAEDDRNARWPYEPGEGAEQCGLARAAGAEDREEEPARHLQVEVEQHGDRTGAGLQGAHADFGHALTVLRGDGAGTSVPLSAERII